MNDVPVELKERLTEAIKAIDAWQAAHAGQPREPNEVLIAYAVIASWRQFNTDDYDGDQLTQIYGPDSIPDWQAIGLLETSSAYIKHVHSSRDD